MSAVGVEVWLFGGLVATFAIWLVLSVLVVIDRLRYERRRRALAALTPEPTQAPGSSAPTTGLPAAARVLSRLSRRQVYRLVADERMPQSITVLCAAYAVEHWGLPRIVRDASSTRGHKWQRIAALFVLGHVRAPGVHELLAQAIADPDGDVAGAAVVILQHLGDRRAAEILVIALRLQSYPPSRIATQLDKFPRPIDDLLRPLLSDPAPHARYWAASLLRRYPRARGLAPMVAALTRDAEGKVRKVALDTLAGLDPAAAREAAAERLADPVDFVRSMAARVLARVAEADPAPDARRACALQIVPLLADPSWEVRLAAKELLVQLGTDVWQEVAAGLDSSDRFARNGAAEVLQNLRMIDAVIDELARDVEPSAELMGVLERVFREGGRPMVDAAVERSGPERSTAEVLLTRLGMAA